MSERDVPVPDILPGWYGKLPGMGDFAHRRVPDAFRQAWDRWLQNGLAQLRARHEDWTDRYLKAPLWCFVLGDGVIGEPSWIGVLMPSVDSVGRYFPFTIVDELVWAPAELRGDVLSRAQRWFVMAAQVAVDGLDKDLDASRFEALLLQSFSVEQAAPSLQEQSDEAEMALPEFGQSLWFTDPAAETGQAMSTQGLPQDEQFETLFGYAAGHEEQP
ncbi:type VI secretion system-associated protein TagF [Variovorax sp. J22R133]|uniref:type VI secretion system-associated protein TagF n=1 Tax=Variovorax brevis TaxID=3053503 RepID=UPI00257542C1|nr:type VI secretion system-associated protein TagF [Variovorax sp. J22R133]MDM0117247.1 type VI secretion system-associated protein TagF [Variovorax sp. J22R133]